MMVEVSNNGAEYFGGDMRFRYTEQWKVVSAYPSRGPDAGRTVVTVIGEGFPSESSFSCRFGKGTASKGQRMSASMVRCTSPSRGASGNVSISLSDNWGDYKHGGALFRYEATLQAKSAMTTSGFVDGGTEVSKARAILIHGGNTAADTEGCLLPGTTKSTDFVGSSQKKLKEIFKVIEDNKIEGATIVITEDYED